MPLTVNQMLTTGLDSSCVSTLIFLHQVVGQAKLSLHLLLLFPAHTHIQKHTESFIINK